MARYRNTKFQSKMGETIMRFTYNSKSVLLAATALGMAVASPAWAQAAKGKTAATAADDDNANYIIVTARRIEEKLQDVPISITVLNEKTLANNNIQSAKDIATYTPGLSTNNRFGSDNTTWTVRGFTQEQRTTATVGTYFADVVAPRGSGATQGGDGAGPGNLFDLSNVQVLKGPQGTLQGRNSTGGAVMLVPKKPTSKFEGFIEASLGDYNLRRVTAVVNVPVNETFRMRIGVDRNKRDGYLQNAGAIGFGPNGKAGGSVDYWAARFSAVWDVTPDIESYTVATWSHSKSTGVIPKITQAFYREPYSGLTGAAPLGTLDAGQNVTGLVTSNGLIAMNQMANEAANCGGNWWCVSNSVWDSRSESKTWQAINTTKWEANDHLTVKNIISYSHFYGDTTLDLFGLYNPTVAGIPTNAVSTAQFAAVNSPLAVRNFSMTRAPYGLHTNAEASFVEELQFQGHGDTFNWQGGLYLESSNPLGKSGTAGPSQTPCGPNGSALPAVGGITVQTDPGQICMSTGTQQFSLGRVGLSLTKNYFRDKAIYWQGIYKLNDKIKLTGGIRYTWDTMTSNFQLINLRYYTNANLAVTSLSTGFNSKTLTVPNGNTALAGLANGVGFCNNNVTFGYPANIQDGTNVSNPSKGFFAASDAANQCKEAHTVKTSAPTWLLGIDFKPNDTTLLYAKYSRGYRQGGVASFGLDQVQDYNKEKVDTFEVGAKTSWRGQMPGYFNISAFHNNFSDQQLQIGIQCNPTSVCPQTTVILNQGKSKLSGLEIEAGVTLFKGFKLEASYAYLKTKVSQVTDVSTYILSRNSTLAGLDLRPLPVNSPIPNAIPHKLVLTGSYRLPLPETVGRVTLGATMVYTSAYRAVSDPPVLGSCLLALTGAAQTANTNINLFNCSAAVPATFASSYGILPKTNVININVNWDSVGGMPIDAAFFITNLTNEHVLLHANVQAGSGFVSNIIGEPRMFGARLKYRFGG
jgi:iron complex outermembrane recepter protein